MRRSLSLFPLASLAVVALAAQAEEPRQLGAHVHGVSHLDVAIEGQTLEMALAAPGMDIVGFEHAPSSPAGETAVAEALAALRSPLALFVLPKAAGCTVESAEAALELEEHHHDHDEDHDHEKHEDDHDHEAHDHDKHDKDHDHDAHEKEGHDHADEHDHDKDHDHDKEHDEKHDHDHDHEKSHDHDEKGHEHEDEHEHDDHEGHDHAEGGHSEFTASYRLTCAAPEKITEVQFPYFDRFENAQHLVLRIVTRNGAQSFDVERESPSLSLKGKL